MSVVAVCQVRIDIDDPENSWQAVTTAVLQAAKSGAEVVVLPELAFPGSAFSSIAEAANRAEEVNGTTAAHMRKLSAELGIVLIFGFAERNLDGARPYNSALLIDHGEVLAVYRKTHLWNQEKLIFEPGKELPPVVTTSAGRVAVMICYDLEFPEMVRNVTLRGAQLVAVPANWPVLPIPPQERPIEVAKAQAGAAMNRVFIAVADRCGAERGIDWFGSSVICDVTGFPLAGPACGEPVIMLATLDFHQADDKRLGPHNDALLDRRLNLAEPTSGKDGGTDGRLATRPPGFA
jgi:5-aminopentanamidase